MRKIRNAPGWLELNDDRTAFVYNDERAEVVRRIFQMSISGHGGYTIAKLLNEAGVPAFGASKRWDQSTIHNMLRSRATVGEYQKKRKINGREVPVEEPVTSYYPAVIDLATFEAAQKIRRENLSSRRGRKGSAVTNLFAGIPRCLYCNSTVKLHNAAVKSLICKKAWERTGCFPYKWTYTDFEEILLEQLLQLDSTLQSHLEAVRKANGRADGNALYHARLALAQRVRSVVSVLKIAFAGAEPDQPSRPIIRKDHPRRYFELSLVDGRAHVGSPGLKCKHRINSIDANEICQRLGLSQRQGQITALLAEGSTLSGIAAEIGMTLSTARWHLREVFKRTSCHSQSELIDLARRAL